DRHRVSHGVETVLTTPAGRGSSPAHGDEGRGLSPAHGDEGRGLSPAHGGRRDMTYKRIVIGTDGSETAAVAQRAATLLAKEMGAELVVTHAVDPSGFDPGKAEEVVRTAVEWSLAEGAKARGERRGGNPTEVLMRTARDVDADLIVVGNRGMGERAGRFVSGGVPDEISHGSPTDLLIVRTATRAEGIRE